MQETQIFMILMQNFEEKKFENTFERLF